MHEKYIPDSTRREEVSRSWSRISGRKFLSLLRAGLLAIPLASMPVGENPGSAEVHPSENLTGTYSSDVQRSEIRLEKNSNGVDVVRIPQNHINQRREAFIEGFEISVDELKQWFTVVEKGGAVRLEPTDKWQTTVQKNKSHR